MRRWTRVSRKDKGWGSYFRGKNTNKTKCHISAQFIFIYFFWHILLFQALPLIIYYILWPHNRYIIQNPQKVRKCESPKIKIAVVFVFHDIRFNALMQINSIYLQKMMKKTTENLHPITLKDLRLFLVSFCRNYQDYFDCVQNSPVRCCRYLIAVYRREILILLRSFHSLLYRIGIFGYKLFYLTCCANKRSTFSMIASK